ncbi:MAG TPA: hypothetical protein DDY17_06260 [Syntrophaceae bacterium]|nr:hypothetical protein [Syntrophaceae bacterium]
MTPVAISEKRCPESTMRTGFPSVLSFSAKDTRRARPPSTLLPQVGQGKRCPLRLLLWMIVKFIGSAKRSEAGKIKKRSVMISMANLFMALCDLWKTIYSFIRRFLRELMPYAALCGESSIL